MARTHEFDVCYFVKPWYIPHMSDDRVITSRQCAHSTRGLDSCHRVLFTQGFLDTSFRPMDDTVKLDPEAFSREQIERVIDTATYDGRWRQRAETDPQSVVSVLGATEPSSEEGSDTLADVVSVIAVVSSLAFCPQVAPDVQASSRKTWESLVDAGVVEALCRNVTDSVMLANRAGPGQDEVQCVFHCMAGHAN